MSDKATFFSWLNLRRKGLEQVKACVEGGQHDDACEQLLSYYRTRKGINYYDGWDNRKLDLDYDTNVFCLDVPL